jgi:hypothetical protein
MRTIVGIIMALMLSLPGILRAQTDTLALWHFENSTKRGLITNNASFISDPYTADDGTVFNKDIAPIALSGSVFSAWVTGTGGTGTFAANSNTWNDGANTKYWYVTISTLGYENIKLSSKQMGSNTGPKDFQAEFSTDGNTWTPISGGTILVLNDLFTSGVLNELALPFACDNQPSLSIRWLVTSTVSIGGATVGGSGTNRIDDIVITGTPGSFANDATIAPDNAVFNIDQPAGIETTINWNDATSLIRITNSNVPPDTLISGTDFLLTVDTVTINTTYLQSQYTSVGQQHLLYFHFDVGNPDLMTITWDNDTLYGAVLDPDTAQYDLSIPGDISTTITWNDASSVVSITDEGTPYTLQAGDFTVAGNALTIHDTYLSTVLTSVGQQLVLTVAFDQGAGDYFTINTVASPPAPMVIASWNFEDTAKRGQITDNATFISNPYTADDGISANINISPLRLIGGNNFSGWVTGVGVGFAPNSNNWNAGAGSKYWEVEISTSGYGELTLSSKQRSSAGGPANFIVEYSFDGTTWSVVPGSEIDVAENFTSGVLADISLPLLCEDRNPLYLRWVMENDSAVNGSPVTTTGTNRIDDIL